MAQENPLLATAYHEAGHAVAAVLLKRRFQMISILPDGESEGHVSLSGLGKVQSEVPVEARTRRKLEREILIYLAGPTAEALGTGTRELLINHTDLNEAVALADHLTTSPREADAYLHWLGLRAEALIRPPGPWAAVQTLATALLERQQLGYRRARQIIREALDQSRAAPLAGQGEPGNDKEASPAEECLRDLEAALSDWQLVRLASPHQVARALATRSREELRTMRDTLKEILADVEMAWKEAGDP